MKQKFSIAQIFLFHSIHFQFKHIWYCQKLLFSCEDTAQQVLMSVCLCVCLQVEILPQSKVPKGYPVPRDTQ